MKKIILIVVIIGLVLFGLIQLIPVDRSNPQPSKEPNWSSPEASALVKEHCFDCHSDETVWPWYGYVAPSSWLLKWDVDRGRRRLNFSEWDKRPTSLDEMVEKIQSGEMPPMQYTLIHTNSRLNDQQKQALIDALNGLYKK
jgi:hypothetical protein